MALDIRVLDEKGEEIQLSTLCVDDEPTPYSGKPSLPLDDEETYTDEKELSKSFLFSDEDGNLIEDEEEDDFSYSEEEVYEDVSFEDYED